MIRKIAINDANILIDLVKTGLFEASLKLPIVYHTTSIIFEELYSHQQALFNISIQQERYKIIEISLEEMGEIEALVPLDVALSIQDWSAYYFAKKWNCLLLTGDNRLRIRAASDGIKVHGVLWILDELLANGCINRSEAHQLLQQLMSINKRLPQKDCVERLKAYSFEE